MIKPRGDGEPRADGEGSHWFCGCGPGTQECHCHDCLLSQRDAARAEAQELRAMAWEPELRRRVQIVARAEARCEWLKEAPASE